MAKDIQPHMTTLQTALAPSQRILAVESLADGRHGSSDQVKAILFQVAQSDLCPAVRACAIEKLSGLGYCQPAFVEYLKTASEDRSDEVKEAARAATQKLTSHQR